MASIRYLLFLFMVILADQALGQQPPTVVVTKLSVAGYPLLARQARQQGDVTARVSLDKNGQVVELDEINGPALLRDAIRVVKDWRFVVPDGSPVTIPMTFRFRLVGEERESARTELSAELPGLVVITTNPTSEKPSPDVFKRKK